MSARCRPSRSATDHSAGDGPVAIVGASLGGLRMAESLRRAGYSGPITIFGDEKHLPYNRPPLSKEVLTSPVDYDDILLPRRAAVSDIEWRLARPIESASLSRHELTDTAGETHRYRALVVATGARARRLRLTHTPATGRFALRTVDDARALRSCLRPGARLVVVGAGFVGCEVASAARTLGCEVSVVGTSSFPMERPLGAALAQELMRRHEEHGVRFHMNSRVVGIAGTSRPTEVVLRTGASIPCDLVLEAVGSEPNVEWLAGNDIDIQQGVRTDNAMRALRTDGRPWPDVLAVGDVARFPLTPYGQEVMIGHWNIPIETARRAADVLAEMLAGDSHSIETLGKPFAPMPVFWTNQFEVRLLAFGMPEIAETTTLIEGSLKGDCVFGYYRGGVMVGVCGMGLRPTVLRYRAKMMEMPA